MKDCIGFVELLDTFGDDLTVVNAARVSFDKESHALTEQDQKLIRYLAAHDHVTPFFHPQARFRIHMPIFVARQWYKHQVGFSRNEVSRRYVDAPPECYVPAPEDIRERDARVKQGSKESAVDQSVAMHHIMKEQTQRSLECYQHLLDQQVAPEVARQVLGQNMYTSFIETGSLAAYARLCRLRLDPSAQREIQWYADAVHELMEQKFPVSWPVLVPNSAST